MTLQNKLIYTHYKYENSSEASFHTIKIPLNIVERNRTENDIESPKKVFERP